MKTMSRLESVYPDLADSLGKATLLKQQQVVADACSISILHTGLEGKEIDAALEIIRQGGVVENTLYQRLIELVSKYDDQYFQLDEAGDCNAIKQFSKARAVSALATALSDIPGHLHEALYEAISSIEEPSEIIRAAELKL